MEVSKTSTNKSTGFIIIILFYITGLDFIILTSLFPTIIIEKNFIKDYHAHIISFFISFIIAFNVFSNSGKCTNLISALLNILTSIGLFIENSNIVFIICYSLKGMAIGSNLSLAFHMLSNKECYEIQNIKRRVISAFIYFSIISGALFSILIKWIEWKILYLFSLPFSTTLLILLLYNKQLNNEYLKKSYMLTIDFSGTLILYSKYSYKY
ncbi:hypothetical protein BCR32DRAFT_72402 [Anaeromyces robustus]|uniref:Major facilitator superfamily (MFS) profile domain-containing protein n=1 Tax=Anaeromyces robustus TaxID=1754192 RepID=A0A1Y1WT37_9FUNG|nr:hypothetical protein BCR32DRAFT_72402 [Anaeromyces robustus]|eukprot:ORX76693.1 hypothetical protein BCR32DRAFT_72402 [Anaeromyces robustus]